MRKYENSLRHLSVTTVAFLLGTSCLLARSARHKERPELSEVLSHMNQSAKGLKTLSADLKLTKVTVLVNDRSTEAGKFYFRNAKSPEILIDFKIPDAKVVLLKKNKLEYYLPKINQIQEYDLSNHSELMQQVLLVGFGSDTEELQSAYHLKYLHDDQLDNEATAVLELVPREVKVAAQLAKVQLWISEESWLPVQQKFFETGGDYTIARYTSVRINRSLPSSVFRIRAAKGAKRVKM